MWSRGSKLHIVHDFKNPHFVLDDGAIIDWHLGNELDGEWTVELPNALSCIRDVVHVVSEVSLNDQNQVITASKTVIGPGIHRTAVM